MSWLKNIARRLLPEDPDEGCGWWIFKLKAKELVRPCVLHDKDFDDASKGAGEKTLDEADWLLFWRWVLVVKAVPDMRRRLELVGEICEAWPLARTFGAVLWDGDPTPEEILKRLKTEMNSIASSRNSRKMN